jgi:flavin reductase (DIM6/NTAB) family NADH-FMN oxidoreductase RutF
LAIHVLPPTANSVKLGRIFAKGIKYDNTKGEEKLAPTSQELQDGQIFHEMTSPFTEIPHSEWSFKSINDQIKVPILNESETIFICKTQKSFEVDNHEIWVVQVLEIIRNTNYSKSGGLLYFNRGFHQIGSILHE